MYIYTNVISYISLFSCASRDLERSTVKQSNVANAFVLKEIDYQCDTGA